MLDFKSFTENLSATLKALTPKITVAFAGAAGILLYIHMRGWMLLPPVVIVSALVVGVLCACLAFTSLLASFWTATRDMRQQIARMLFRQRDKKRIDAELEFLTPQEREIIAYLLATQRGDPSQFSAMY